MDYLQLQRYYHFLESHSQIFITLPITFCQPFSCLNQITLTVCLISFCKVHDYFILICRDETSPWESQQMSWWVVRKLSAVGTKCLIEPVFGFIKYIYVSVYYICIYSLYLDFNPLCPQKESNTLK